MTQKHDLAALVASRICHDLISPIGAIGNGVELMAMEAGGPARPELSLIAESVANANARIRFFRISYGAAGQDQRIARSEVLSILTDLGRSGRLGYAWTSSGDLSRRDVRLIFLLLQCLETALAYGGRIDVTEGPSGWTVLAEATRLKYDADLWRCLTDASAFVEIVAGMVHFALAADDLATRGVTLRTEVTDRSISLSF
ncbi:MAG: histidine phosphotransferase family protein [Tabrizicola sp.]|jgi:histidine phosphotransferase ChpT|nr:histidine phosphotransferase family protein [Tabrizicola sp.]